jgi:hypothetical protein
MKKQLLIIFLAFTTISLCGQNNVGLQKKDLIGTWLIKEIKVNGILKPDFDPKLQDVIILNENNTQVTTDKANKMEQKGPWKILNKKFIELTDSETKEKQLMEVVSLKGIELKVKIVEEDTKIEMLLNKK